MAMAQAVEPTNAIEWIVLKDVTDYTWNIRELRNTKRRLSVLRSKKYHEIHPLFLDRLDSIESTNKLLEVAEAAGRKC